MLCCNNVEIIVYRIVFIQVKSSVHFIWCNFDTSSAVFTVYFINIIIIDLLNTASLNQVYNLRLHDYLSFPCQKWIGQCWLIDPVWRRSGFIHRDQQTELGLPSLSVCSVSADLTPVSWFTPIDPVMWQTVEWRRM